ncbi:AAA family ATPase [uncultured Methanolobus sp.]|uniref:AAA family ATPase n=1 Tax=uncultured Methanolobus sp. TaxID=218300 RepID=UPI002AAB645D|nr:AAA family ATPase [uncultured Methanolobus sp.]
MKIHTLRLRNFRKFSDYTFQFNSQFTVLIGDNASGKSSVLDASSIMLGSYLLKFNVGSGGRSGIKKTDAKLKIFEKNDQITLEQQVPIFLTAQGTLHGNNIEWTRNLGDRGKEARELIQIGHEDLLSVSKGEDVNLPIMLYYGTGRLWDYHRKVPVGKPESRTVGYRNCLDMKSDHHLFEKWFKHLELSALQRNKNIGTLEAVRLAVKTCIPKAEHFYYDVANDSLIIEFKDEGYCLFGNLSDGYRNMIAMVADIAHRCARLNPHLAAEAARESSGVVLIDEIDLHLHPQWQRHVVRDLKKAFPKMQFIVTTHSPFILQSLELGEVIDLNKTDFGITLSSIDDIATPAPSGEYSDKSIEDIVEYVMGVEVPQRSHRQQEMYSVAKQYYTVLQEAKDSNNSKKEELKSKLDELSAPFSDNQAYHAFLEMERIDAGLGSQKRKGYK